MPRPRACIELEGGIRILLENPHDVDLAAGLINTIVENCRRLGINTREYLEDVLTRLPAMKASEAASLTPSNWLAERTRKSVRAAA